jgi:predicted house-cleaning noncanonical NTP pyrophosphatase (MazG superfamily)
MEKIYNKLVRDKIPEIIEADGKKTEIKTLEQKEFATALFAKLQEEVEECISSQGNEEELAKEIGDVYEVLEAISDHYGLDVEVIKKIKAERKEKRGGFEKRIFLESVEE